MIIGVPKELKAGERRVALTPDGVHALVTAGHQVLIQKDAGALSGFPDEDFSKSGAEMVPSLEDVWGRCELLVKVKEPAPEEIKLFRKGMSVFSFLHLAVAPQLTRAMVESGVTGLDYDLVMTDDGRLPILEPMSIIAGKLAVQAGANALQADGGGQGVLMGGAIGVPGARVVVVGAGAAGSHAAYVAIGMGAQVTVLDVDPKKLLPFETAGIRTVYSTPKSLLREVKDANLVIGSVLIPGALAPKLITRDILGKMKNGSVIVDICIDQGGFAESSRPTTIAEPTYIDTGVIHYCVTNMPALVCRTSTKALTNATLPYLLMLADEGIEETLRKSPPMRRSLTSYQGHLTNTVIGKAIDYESLPEGEVNRLLGLV